MYNLNIFEMDSKEYTQVYQQLKAIPWLSKEVRSVNLCHNSLESYESLKPLKELRVLLLEDNRIMQMSPMESGNLSVLNLAFNSIVKIELFSLSKLQKLYLNNN